jgi:hypothetical protein
LQTSRLKMGIWRTSSRHQVLEAHREGLSKTMHSYLYRWS